MAAPLRRCGRSMTSAQSPVAALEVRSLCAGYPGTPRAIDGLSFTLQAGRVRRAGRPQRRRQEHAAALHRRLQPFGSGKISVHGHDCRSSHAQVGHVPQRNTVDWHFPLSARDVVLMGRARNSRWLPWWPRRERERVDDELLHLLRLESLANSAIGELSTGQQQRVFIRARAGPGSRGVAADEPLNGVDVAAAARDHGHAGPPAGSAASRCCWPRTTWATPPATSSACSCCAARCWRMAHRRRCCARNCCNAPTATASACCCNATGTLLVANEHSP